MNQPQRTFIGIFGRRNQGKSALINAIAGQDIAIVSEVAGTTTDPVKKTIEILGLGPAVLVDTAGIDDSGTGIGQQRVQRSLDALQTIDIDLLVVSGNRFTPEDTDLIGQFQAADIPFVIAHNKSDLEPLSADFARQAAAYNVPVVACSAVRREGIPQLIEALAAALPGSDTEEESLTGGLVRAGDTVVLVMPQDSEAPEGRLIRPQAQLIRELLDHHAVAIALQPEELSSFLQKHTPTLVITDSQAFAAVAPLVPAHVPLTSFSIVLARAKGHFELYLHDTPSIGQLHAGDRVLIMESCTHPASCDDIGRHKLPKLLQKRAGCELQFDFVAALDPLPTDLSQYALAVQCGGCMVTRRQLWNRVERVHRSGVPVTNYGMAIAYATGIFNRVTAPFRNAETS